MQDGKNALPRPRQAVMIRNSRAGLDPKESKKRASKEQNRREALPLPIPEVR